MLYVEQIVLNSRVRDTNRKRGTLGFSISHLPPQSHISFFSEECSDKGGTSAGSCAEGYGVCCTCKYFRNNN